MKKITVTPLVTPEVKLRRFVRKLFTLIRPIRFVAIYGIWISLFRLLTLSFITYFTISPTSRFQDISDAFGSNEVSLMGLSAFLFTWLLYGLSPLNSLPLSDIIDRKKIEKNFFPGFIRGITFGGIFAFLFVLCGYYRYLGFFIQFEEAPLEMLNVVLRMVTLITLTYCEEYLFRKKVRDLLSDTFPPIVFLQLTAIFYVGIKILQFDLGITQIITLYLASLALSYRAEHLKQFTFGAGFWSAILIVFQPLLSLPIFGNDFSGIVIVKYQAALSSTSNDPELLSTFLRYFMGGAGGPLSSLVFQLFLILDICRSILRRKV